jgi:tRNA dimethylallyltransferase
MSLAPEIGAEIVSVDSATVYRGMDVGTAKPAPAERAAVAHHLLDLADPSENPTVAEFQRRGRAAVDEVLVRGRVPLLVGGSGLYFRAIVDPLEFPGTATEVRRRIEQELEQLGHEELHRRLAEIDPEGAMRIHPSNTRRTVRALEVAELTGNRFSAYRVAWEERRSIYDLAAAGLTLRIEELDKRIDARVERLIEAGWVEEVRRLLPGGFSATAIKVLGYAQIRSYLEGSLSLEAAVAEIKRRTRKFARRQLRWFRADPRIRWFEDHAQAAEFLRKEAS